MQLVEAFQAGGVYAGSPAAWFCDMLFYGYVALAFLGSDCLRHDTYIAINHASTKLLHSEYGGQNMGSEG